MYIVVMKAQGQFSVVCPEMFYLCLVCNSHLIRFKKQQICCTTLTHDEMIKGTMSGVFGLFWDICAPTNVCVKDIGS